ncbi:hypothetical protein TNCV_2965121 [Trichonephila clavipes]|nr:hypothetical protein TNCV_2965121 [Trichonephila clavipes]
MSSVPRLNTRTSYYLGKRIVNDDFRQDWCARNLAASSTSILLRGISQNIRNFMQRRCQTSQKTSCCNFINMLLLCPSRWERRKVARA